MKNYYTCIVCPRSCDLVVEEKDGTCTVSGNSCKRGEEYGLNEHLHPKRMVTTTVKIIGGNARCLPVVSSGPVPKEKLPDCLDWLYTIKVEAPVHLHDVIVENILGTGVNVLAARDAERTD